jgi:hypothetical protein
MKITQSTERCGIHNSHNISIFVDVDESQKEMIEGALEGFLNAFGCTVCYVEMIDMSIDIYVALFVDKFLPAYLPVMDKVTAERKLNVQFKPLSYG